MRKKLAAGLLALTTATTGALFVGETAPAEAASGDITVLTYNVRGAKTDADSPTGLRWANRERAVIANIRRHEPDIFGVQEASRSGSQDAAVDLLAAFQGDYGAYPTSSTELGGPKTIFYDKSRFTPVISDGAPAQGTVAVYTAPESGPITCWTTRHMSWIILRDNVTNQRLFVGNTHLPVGAGCADAQLHAAKRVRKTIATKNPSNLPTIMMGDMNNQPAPCFANPNSSRAAALKWLLSQSATGMILQPDAALTNCNATVNAEWPTAQNHGKRLDHILHSRKFEVVDRKVDRRTSSIPNGTTTRSAHASDHFPVIATLRRS